MWYDAICMFGLLMGACRASLHEQLCLKLWVVIVRSELDGVTAGRQTLASFPYRFRVIGQQTWCTQAIRHKTLAFPGVSY